MKMEYLSTQTNMKRAELWSEKEHVYDRDFISFFIEKKLC